MDERRHSCRVAPTQETYVCISGNRTARLMDITPHGAHLELSSALNPNHQCRVVLELEDETLRLTARVAHCKLTGFQSFGSGGQLIYRAGIEFTGVDDEMAEAISQAFPPPAPEPAAKPARRGPIKVKVNVESFERAAASGEREAS
ncbi:MAG: PilZ domain-containing protein [Thermoanaerobaculales bacterium]|nr:PilZ domain-containing protein [Thermoanaerobaculales bacterium]